MVSEANCVSFPCTELLLFNCGQGKDSFPFYGTFKFTFVTLDHKTSQKVTFFYIWLRYNSLNIWNRL